ncbi:MAG TPA: hypothetical protein VKE22_18820 [Haliangiales bacterium]|nr:hypothetical protein [Haliangiales bacterium]
MRFAAFLALVLALVSAASRAGADVVLVGAAGGPTPALVGRGGEIFRWEDGAWRRVAGGVAGDLSVARGPSARDVWALGRRVFHHDGTAWSALPEVGRASVLAADGSIVPGVAHGRSIRLRAGGQWTPLAAAPAPVTAFWAGGARDAVAVTDAGVVRWNGRAWRPVSGAAGALGVAGVDGVALILCADGLRRGGRKLATPPGLAGAPLAAASAARKLFVLYPTALARVDANALVLVAALPEGAGEPAALLARGDDVVVAARRGAVWAWRDGWRAETIVDDAAPAAARAGSPPAVAH